MYFYKFLISFLLALFFSKKFVTPQSCEKMEDCAITEKGTVCSLCVGKIGSAKCIDPFPDKYNIDRNLKCTYRDICEEGGRPICQHHGECRVRDAEGYTCKCKQFYVGRNCEMKYKSIETFNVPHINFKTAIPVIQSTDVCVFIKLSEKIDEVNILSSDGYYVKLKSVESDKLCRANTCVYKFAGNIRYLYKPFHDKDNNLMYLGNTFLGYLTKFKLDIIHRGTTIYNTEFKVYVFYPKNNICMPRVKVRGCGLNHNKPTMYTKGSTISLGSSISILADGNSLNPYDEQDNPICGTDTRIKLSWNIWWLREAFWSSDTIVKEQFDEENLILNPFEEDFEFGLYRVELKGTNVFSEGTSEDLDICYFEIKTLPLEGIIEGGPYRTIAKKQGLVLSAESSIDPNRPPKLKSIMTKWSCTVLRSDESNIGDMCKPVVLKSDEPYYIPPKRLSEGEFNFTLELWTDLDQKGKCEQCANNLRQYNYQIVVITNNKTNLLISCQLNCGKRVSVNDELLLKVSYLDHAEGITFKWDLFKNEKGKEVHLTKHDDYPSYIFIIPEDTLEKNSQYKVSVSATVDGDNVSAVYAFETDNFTYQGDCDIYPDSGIRAVTYFYISCEATESGAYVYEFYDRTLEEARETSPMLGRMLGTSRSGQLEEVFLTRGFLVVYVIIGQNRDMKIYEIDLINDPNLNEALVYNFLQKPLYYKQMSCTLLMQHISSLLDITKNVTGNKNDFLNIFLEKIFPNTIKQVADVKIYSLLLYNTVSTLNEGNINLKAVKTISILVAQMSKILSMYINSKQYKSSINSKEVKETLRTILNSLELSITFQNETELNSFKKSISSSTLYELMEISQQTQKSLSDFQSILSDLQTSGSSPVTITSENNNFVFKVLQEDSKFGFSLFKMLQNTPDIPVTLSAVLKEEVF